MKNKVIQIAIDGPVAAGKSTVAKLLSQKLGFLYIDTGAMYRAAALFIERQGISWENEAAVSTSIKLAKIRLARPVGIKNDGRTASVYLGSEDVSWQIRDSHVAEGASVISQYKKVREMLVLQQQKLAQGENVVMEGRDIGVRVLPQASLKIFMTADVDTRVKRKWDYLKKNHSPLTKMQVKEDLVRRDQREMSRKIDPLKPVVGAWVLDTSGMTIDVVVNVIEEQYNQMYGR